MRFVVYRITYEGPDSKLFYIGYVRRKRFEDENYHGSVSSVKWKELWNGLLRDHPERFSREIDSYHETAAEAHAREIEWQNAEDVLNRDDYVNECIGGLKFAPIEKQSPEHIAKRLASRESFAHSEETKRKISETRKSRHYEMTPEHKSAFTRGHALPDHHREAIRESNRTREVSAETRDKISKSRIGKGKKPRSEESRKKISEGRKAYWAKWREERAKSVLG